MYWLYLFKRGSDQKKELPFPAVTFKCPASVGTYIQTEKFSFTKHLDHGTSSFVFVLFLFSAILM